MTIDLWVDSSWSGVQRYAGIWATGFDSSPSISAYPIIAWLSGGAKGVSPDGFYAFDYINGVWMPLMTASAGDYGKWHTLSFEFNVGTGVEYFVDGVSKLTFADPYTTNLGNLILNAGNFGADYDVYWDNFQVYSATPATFKSALLGQLTINASNVTVTGMYLSNPGQLYGVLINAPYNNINLAYNKVQNVGSGSMTSNVKGVYLQNGPDNVLIENNTFNNISSGPTKSVNAVFVGDSNERRSKHRIRRSG